MVPAGIVTNSTLDVLQEIDAKLDDDTVRVPLPADSVADWPIIGENGLRGLEPRLRPICMPRSRNFSRS